MADPNLELDDPTRDYTGGNVQIGGDTASTLLSPGETGPQSKQLSPTAAEDIQSRVPVTARTTEDKAAIAHLADPYREAPRASVKPPPQTGLNRSIDFRQKGLQAHPVAAQRDHRDLGRPPPDTVQDPHPSEVPNIFHSIGQWFGQTNMGSAMTQMLGGQMAKETDAYIFAKQKSQMNEQTIRYNNMRNRGLDVQTQLETELMDYARAMGGDPKTLTQRLLEVARQHGDTNLPFIVTHQGAQAGLDYLKKLDQTYQDMHKGNATLKALEDETNANQDILNPPADHKPSPTDTTPSDAGAGGDPSAHQVIVEPLTTLPEAAAPAPQPAPQPAPSAPPETPVAPVAPVGPAAPDSGQGGFVPNINAPAGGVQGAVQPDQPVLVAGGGIEDVPRNWYEKMPQVAQADAPPPPDDWQPPESRVMEGAVMKSGQPVPRAAFRQIDDEAANAVMDPRTIQALAKDKNKSVHAGLVERRAIEIRDALGMIANNPNRGLGDRPDPRVISDIQKISPSLGRLAAIVKAVGDGSIPPPARNQMYGSRAGLGQIIFPLIGKYDPTMLRPGVYEARAAGLKAFGPGGKAGQNALSVVTGAKHAGLFAQDIAKWEQWGGLKQLGVGEAASIPGEGNLGLNRILRMGGQALMSPETQTLQGSMDFNLHVVIRELERGYTGAQPHEAGIKDIVEKLDWKNNSPEVVKGALSRAIALLRERLQESMAQFDTTVGKDPASYMGNYIRGYVSKGLGVLPEGEVVKPEDMGILDRMIQQINSRSAPPRAQGPSPPTGGPTPGAVEDGWRFKGGDPGDQRNWERVQ